MRLYHFILILILLCGAELAHGQKDNAVQKESKKRGKISKVYSVDDARKIMGPDPEGAILILDQIIADGTRLSNVTVTREAYILLGDINYTNQLYPQASERYQKALNISPENNNPRDLFVKLGRTFLFIDANQAKGYFIQCIDSEMGGALDLECKEGLADAHIKLREYDQALGILKLLENEYKSQRSSSLARIQAKIADVYAAQKDIPQAQLNYSNARSNVPIRPSPDDVEILQNASKKLSDVQSYGDNVKLRKANIDYYEESEQNDEAAIERLELAEVYVAGGEVGEAQANLDALKPIITSYPANKVKAEYYKTSSEVFAAEGEYRKAVEAFEQYSLVQDSIYLKREQQLNQRIAISDLQKSVDVSEKESINALDRSRYQSSLVEKQRWLIYLLSALLLGAILSAYLIYRNVQSKNRANRLLELRSLRSEMNPHFIFNALGNVNEYIAANDERKANRFLSDFSRLMRQVLELNRNDVIPLKQEVDLSRLYLKLEHSRWGDKFDYSIDIEDESIPSSLDVPPLLLQPYIENAVWHGLRYLDGQGHLSIRMIQSAQQTQLVIEDNGIGRDQSAALKTSNQKKNKSTGLRNTQRRAQLINELYEKAYQVLIEDAFPDQDNVGTRVTINLST